MESPPPPDLAEGYYVDNVAVMLETVAARYEDLLHPHEQAFIDTFHALSQDAQRLWVRLISRKGPLFRRDLLHYPEIADLDAAAEELITVEFLDRAEDEDPLRILDLLRRDELVELTQSPDVPCSAAARSVRRAEVFGVLAEMLGEVPDGVSPKESWFEDLREGLGILQPLHGDDLLVMRLLFFGNLYQDWTDFVLRDLGVVRYEPYRLDRELRLFPTREALDDTLELRVRNTLVFEVLAEGQLDAARELAEDVVSRTWHEGARRFAHRLLNRVGRALERADLGEEALRLYAQSEATPARERRARLLVALQRDDEALALCAEIEEDPHDESEAVFAPRFAHQIRRRRKEVPPWRRPKRPVQELVLPKRDNATVETLVLEHLATEAREGFFAENWLWRSLFGLAFWDVIFAPVDGAFQHPFQSGPLDLHSADFRRARRDEVERRLEEIRTAEDLSAELLARWDEKVGTSSSLVSWHPSARPRLAMALEILSAPHLAHVFDRLSRDPKRYRRGFPDLFVLCDDGPGFELLEVKAPGDQLRPEQGGWIDHFNAGGMPAAILKVRWS